MSFRRSASASSFTNNNSGQGNSKSGTSSVKSSKSANKNSAILSNSFTGKSFNNKNVIDSSRTDISDVSDVLSVTGANPANQRVTKKPVTKKSLKPASDNTTKQVKQKPDAFFIPGKERQVKVKAIKKPAWASKPPDDDETPRSEVPSTYLCPPRHSSLDDFLNDFDDDNDGSKTPNKISESLLQFEQDEMKSESASPGSLLEMLAADTARANQMYADIKHGESGDLWNPSSLQEEGKSEWQKLREKSVEKEQTDAKLTGGGNRAKINTLGNDNPNDPYVPPWSHANTETPSWHLTDEDGPFWSKTSTKHTSKSSGISTQSGAKFTTAKLPGNTANEIKAKESKSLTNLKRPASDPKKSKISEFSKKTTIAPQSRKALSPTNTTTKASTTFGKPAAISSIDDSKAVTYSWRNVEPLELDRLTSAEKNLHYKTDDYLIERREQAARKIQVWYRRLARERVRKQAGAAAMKRMMMSKGKQIEERMNTEKVKEHEKIKTDYEFSRKQEEDQMAARQATIDDMKQKRASEQSKRKVQTLGLSDIANKSGMKFIQGSGKVTNIQKTKRSAVNRTPGAASNNSNNPSSKCDEDSSEFCSDFDTEVEKKTNSKPLQKNSVTRNVGRKLNATAALIEPSHRPTTADNRKLDEIFESGSNKAQTIDTARTDDTDSTLLATCKSSNHGGANSKTTFDSLLETLKELEDEPGTPQPHNNEKPAEFTLKETWKDDKLKSSSLTEDALGTHTENLKMGSDGNNSLLSADKLKSIMNFLDEVEKVEDDVRSEVSKSRDLLKSVYAEELNDEISRENKRDILEREEIAMESASQVASDISNAINAQKMEIEHKEKTVEMMKKSMNQQREFTTMQMKEMDKEHKQQLTIQKKDYESTIQRHLSFIDQLIDDKKKLSSRCEELVTTLKETDGKYASKMKQMENNHSHELGKQKEVSEAAEKLRREKWIQEKTQQIKEMTVKGLEPDIQKLIAKHKAEIKKIKAMKQVSLSALGS